MGFSWIDLEIGSFSGIILTMSKGIEIERKFLITGPPENLPGGPRSFKGTIINQGYLEISLDGSEKRVRRKGNKFYLTQKSGMGKVRAETEGEISEEDFSIIALSMGAIRE